MADEHVPEVGSIGWMNLTVAEADSVRDFYTSVVGWGVEACDMGGYSDYTMTTASGKPVSGVCWSKGVNAGIPPAWLMYITIADMDASIAKVLELGGKVLVGPKSMGKARYAVIEDPAGANCALYQP
jgi:predicted enzyme related to lactoylglutathione lyase